MSEELHKDVLKLLGFNVIRQGYHDYDQQYINGYLLVRHDRMIRFSPHYAEGQAWAQAPTLDALMPSLIAAIVQPSYPSLYLGDLYMHNEKIVCRFRGTDDVLTFVTLAEAVASVFKASCAVGIIDPKTVVLP